MPAGSRTGDPGRALGPSERVASHRAAQLSQDLPPTPVLLFSELLAQDKEEQRTTIG